MKIKCNYIVMILALFLFTACEKTFLGEDDVNEPERNFEIFWSDFDEHYALFTVRHLNWDSIYQVYRPQVTPQTTDDQLWTIFSKIVDYLEDGHTKIFNPNVTNHRAEQALRDSTIAEFSRPLVVSNYLEAFKEVDEDGVFSYGKIKDKRVGYLHLFGMSDDYEKDIDQVMNELQDYDAIIVDIRNNGGGDGDFAAALAGAFADGEHFIFTAQTRNGPKHDDFDEITKFYTQPRGSEQYTKPVILLTDQYTVSAAEEFLWHMNAFVHVTQLGDVSAGDLSDLSNFRFLPNGWVYHYSIQMYLTPDGKTLDGVGFIPDVYVRNTEQDIAAGNDVVMERAFEFLKEEYGIE